MAAHKRPAITAGGIGIHAAITPQKTGAGRANADHSEATTNPATAVGGRKFSSS